jgi:ssDNA-binding Zn-finger/Zn-ribbon topoisomerase 1
MTNLKGNNEIQHIFFFKCLGCKSCNYYSSDLDEDNNCGTCGHRF